MRQRGNVELNLPEALFQRNFSKRAELSISCVVHEDIHENVLSRHLVEKKLRSRGCRQIERKRSGAYLEPTLQLVRELREPRSVSSDENQVVVVPGEKLGEFAPDAGRGAGDECGLVLTVHADLTRRRVVRGYLE